MTPFVFAALLALLLWSGAGAQSAGGSPAPQPAAGATWYVDDAVPLSGDGATLATAVRTIPEGLALAAAGDTVVAAAGVYTETRLPDEEPWLWRPLTVPAGVGLAGAGAGASIIDAAVVLVQESRLEGFTVRSTSGSTVRVHGGGASVRNNRIEEGGTGIEVNCIAGPEECAAPVELAFNVVADALYTGVQVSGASVADVRSNTIRMADQDSDNTVGIWVSSAASTVESNAILGAYFGIYCGSNAGAAVAHNNVEGSKWAFGAACALGLGNSKFSALLRDPAADDLRLTAGSPLRKRGVPSGADIGALPFTPIGEAPANVTLTEIGGRQARLEWEDAGAEAYDVFVASEDGVYRERHAITAGTTAIITLTSPLANRAAVSSVDDSGAASELTAVQYAPPTLRDATVEQDSSLVWIDGDWQTVENPNASGGAYLESTAESAQMRIAFAGSTLVLGRRAGPGGGYAKVTVDGVDRGTLNFDFPEVRWRVPATLSGFGPGAHLLTLTPNRYQPETGSTINVDFLTAPAPFVPSTVQVQAVERVNWHRLTAGLKPVQGVAAVHQGAQAHSQFYAANRDDPRMAGLGFHKEQADLPGFTGTWPSDRAAYFGYGYGAGEDGHFIGDPIRSVDGWMATVYHRNLIMCYGCTDAGYGMVAGRDNSADTLNMGGPWQRPEERVVYTYPAGNQTQVPRSWDGGEIPDPLPGRPKPVGYPISLYIEQPRPGEMADAAAEMSLLRDASTEQESSPLWSVTAAELQTVDGAQIPIIMLDQNTDIPKYLGPDVVFLISERPLAKDTTYFAHVAGTDSQGAPFDYRWVFSTGAGLAAPNFSGTQAWVEPPVPAAGQPVTVHLRLANSGLEAGGVTAQAVLPAGAAYIAGSASTSQGTVAGNGPLDFGLGAVARGGVVHLQFAFTAPGEAALPAVLASEIRVDWGLGRIERRPVAIAGGRPLYLPAVSR